MIDGTTWDEVFSKIYKRLDALELLAKYPRYYMSCDPGQGDIGKWYVMKPDRRSGERRGTARNLDWEVKSQDRRSGVERRIGVGRRSFLRGLGGRRIYDHQLETTHDRRSGKDRRG